MTREITAELLESVMGRRLTDLLTAPETWVEEKHRWVAVTVPTERWDDAALWVAIHIARLRCGNTPALFEAWLDRLASGPDHSAEIGDVLVAHVASESIGTPGKPATSIHLEGFVAEHMWHAITCEIAGSLGLPVRVEEPSWSVTDSGGDGLAVFEADPGYAFRLWESKAHTSEEPVRGTVNGACRQLSTNAMRYLARYSKVGQELADRDLASFYGRMTEMWRHADPCGGAGVSICAHGDADWAGLFDGLPRYWGFGDQSQREGLLALIDDYPGFAARVREYLWKGL